MRRFAWLASVLVAAAALAVAPLGAQSFQGTGQEATQLFPLDAGLTVFELSHEGAGDFRVRLLDEQGGVVEELARATGRFQGSRAVGIPQAGRYLLDVSATGAWSVRRRDAAAAGVVDFAALPDTASPVYKAASEAARQVPTNAWLARGFVGGALAGPIGAAIAVGFADRSRVPSPAMAVHGGPEQDPGFDEAFAARVRESRKKKAFIGGMVGSGVFLAGMVWVIQIAQGGSGGGASTPDGGGGQFVVVPR